MYYNATPYNENKNTGKTGSSWKGAGDMDTTLKLNSLQQVHKIKKWTPSEIRERRAKGLCFNCKEK